MLDTPTLDDTTAADEGAVTAPDAQAFGDRAEAMLLGDVPAGADTAPSEDDVAVHLPLATFIDEFGAGLLSQVRSQNPPLYDPVAEASDPATSKVHQERLQALQGLKRKPFEAQAHTVLAAVKQLVDFDDPATIVNAEMGTGKTMMAICVAALLQQRHPRTLVISPPHLVYKWRREILETVPGAKVWVLNGPDTLRKLLALRAGLGLKTSQPEFFVLGRVRMRMGFHWRPAFVPRLVIEQRETEHGDMQALHSRIAVCSDCMKPILRRDEDGNESPMSPLIATQVLGNKRMRCADPACGGALWTLIPSGRPAQSKQDLVLQALQQMPTIGEKTAKRLMDTFGEDALSDMLEDNLYQFINLMDSDGNLVFSDRQAKRMERSLATFEFSVGQGGYQPSEFVKRYLPRHYFGLLVVDEGHEYKNEGSAQGQAMGVLASQCRKTLLLTGTVMGGYADDLFHLLWRLNPAALISDGFRPRNGSMATATMSFMRAHGILKDVYKESSSSHRTAKAKAVTVHTSKAPGFGPVGIMRYVLPMTVFLKLKDIGQKVLPPYNEHFIEVPMTDVQDSAYTRMALSLVQELKRALALGDNSLLGVVMNVLLAWPDCCARPETVRHPRTKAVLYQLPAIFTDADVSPKEAELVRICKAEKALGRKVLAYTVYTGTRDTTARLKALLEGEGLKVAVLRATVDAAKREDWVADQVERGIDVLVCNPELVKTGLDLLDFPTIVFLQSGFNVYTVQQAARRSWRIGQKHDVRVIYLGYARSTQMDCLKLMAKKIAVSQSTSGDMPESGLDVLNDAGDSIEVALAKKLIGDSVQRQASAEPLGYCVA